jgi:hypothetical protein
MSIQLVPHSGIVHSLNDNSRNLIQDALKNLNAVPGDGGEKYRKPPFFTASGELSHRLEFFPTPSKVETKADGQSLALSGTHWEAMASAARTVRRGNRSLVSGTTAARKYKSLF